MAGARFTDRSVLVTGAAGGIGRSIAEAFAREGGRVAALDIDVARTAAWTAAWSEADGPRPLAVAVDVADEASAAAAVATAAAAHGGVDVLVNCAAAFVYGTVESASGADWDRVLGVNVKGAVFMAKAALPLMRSGGRPSHCAVVNISSISGFCGQADFAPYATSKGAIVQLTRNMAADAAPAGIRVNAVCPGPILTDATATHAAGLGRSVESIVHELTSHLLLKRMGSGAEVARAVLFMASDDASFTTGTSLMVDGGYMLC